MCNYYSERLSAERLRSCYEIAPPRVQQYLDAEVGFVLDEIGEDHTVLELGCGYGRVLLPLSRKAAKVVGIDTSRSSLLLARRLLADKHVILAEMDAADLAFRDHQFHAVVCIQNGVSAFHVDQRALVREAVRVTHTDGVILLSTYSERFWEHRLAWFRLQAEKGLVGEIDEEATKRGEIACRDGFRATTLSEDALRGLARGLDVTVSITEVDGSSLFSVMRPIR